MNQITNLLADADAETVQKLIAYAQIETAMAACRQAKALERIANAVDRITAGTVDKEADAQRAFNNALSDLMEQAKRDKEEQQK